ncbi:MAG: CDP-alcohol phosphatidyltransferase family protein [Candidatus Thorarchaeota archaeon]|nr:CDP-alcohol phosphatidyltransferase family protein [Candidatus Thorarchaeota archaeon]
MPSEFRVRRIFKGLVLRIAHPLAKAGVRPNTITYVSLLLSFIAALSLSLTGIQLVFGIFVFVSGLFDGVDGAVARERNVASDVGAFTDSVVDKVSEILILGAIAVVYSGIAFLGVPVELWVIIAISGWILTSYTRSRAAALGVSDLDIGLGARSERLFILVVFSLLNQLLWGLVFVSIIGILTSGYRFYKYQHELNFHPSN